MASGATNTTRIKQLGMFLLDTLIAVIGTVIVESPLWRMIPVHTIPSVIVKMWVLSLVCAALLGFAMYRTWNSNTAKRAWILPAAWFAFGLLVGLGDPHKSVLSTGRDWSGFSGIDCESGGHAEGCSNFFMFTIPLLRSLAYSVGAILASQVLKSQSVKSHSRGDLQ